MQVIPADRPYLIMEFVGEQDLGHVVVVAAHFPHPRSYWDRTMDELFELRKGLRDFLNGTSTRRVIIIADTNEFSHTSNYDIMEYLKVPEGPIVGTALRATCCYDNDFAGCRPKSSRPRVREGAVAHRCIEERRCVPAFAVIGRPCRLNEERRIAWSSASVALRQRQWRSFESLPSA